MWLAVVALVGVVVWMLGLHRCAALRELDSQRHLADLERVKHEASPTQERLTLALAGGRLVLWDWDIETGKVSCDGRWADMPGSTSEGVPSNMDAWLELIHEDDLATVEEALDMHMRGEAPFYETEHRFRTQSGEWRWVLSRGQVVERSDDGRPVRIAGTHLDITDRKESERRYRLLFTELLSGFALHEIICDEHGEPCDYRFLEANPAFEKLTGLKVEELVGKTVREVLPGIEDVWIKRYGKVALTGEPTHFDHYSAPLQRTFDVAAFCPAPRQFAVIFTDVTERKQGEEDRRNLDTQVQQAQKLESLGVLAGGIAHDFNNLLMGILGNADLALDEISGSSPARASIHGIETAAKRAADLCRQMLAYSGRGQFVVEPIDLNFVIEDITRLLEVSTSKTAVLRFRLGEDLPAVDADVTQLRQVVMNLITNASEAIGTRSGVITITTGQMSSTRTYLARTFMDEDLPEGDYVFLEVSDTGCGMEAATREKVFDPFFTTKFTGRGLGLAAVLGIVRGHHGAIKVYSEPGSGTTFKVLLPASGRPPTPLPTRAEAELGHDGHGLILLVDDEEITRDVGGRMLTRSGYSVVTAPNGREALEIFRERSHEIACVLLDLTMPGMDGRDAFREIRQLRPDAKVILSSGYNEQEAVNQFAGKGLSGFIQKPYERATLIGKISEVLG